MTILPRFLHSWGKNPHESDFLRKVSRENWIWLETYLFVYKINLYIGV